MSVSICVSVSVSDLWCFRLYLRCLFCLVPSYCSIHTVLTSRWSYSCCLTDEGSSDEFDRGAVKCVLDLRQSPPKYEKRGVSPFPVKLRETGINLVKDSWRQSHHSEEVDSNIQRRMMPHGPYSVGDIAADDQGEEVMAREAAEAAAERAACRLKRASFTHSPPPSPELVNGVDRECQEFENDDRQNSLENFFLPEPFTVSVFDDDTVYMDGEDDTLQTLLDSVNRTRSAHRAKHLKQFAVADPWADTGEIMLWDDDDDDGHDDHDDDDELLSDSNSDWNGAENTGGNDVHFTMVEVDLPDEPLAPPPEFQDGFEASPEFIPLPVEFDLVDIDPNLDSMLLPPPVGFDSQLSSEMLCTPQQEEYMSTFPPEVASLPLEVVPFPPPDFSSLPEGFVSSSPPPEEFSSAPPPEEFASSAEVVEESHPPALPLFASSVSVALDSNATLATASSRQSIILTENIPDWLRRELEEPHLRTKGDHLERDIVQDEVDDECLLPATVTAIDDFEVEDACLQQQEFGYIPAHQLPLPCDLSPLLEVTAESELMEQMDFDVPPPVIELEATTTTTEVSEQMLVFPPPLPTSPVPDEVSDMKEMATGIKDKEDEEQKEQEEEEEDRGPSIVPVSEKTAEVLKGSSMFGTSLRTSNRRVPPPTFPRPRSVTGPPREHKEAHDMRQTGSVVRENRERKERPSSAGSASPRAGRLSKIVPKITSRFSPKLSQQKHSPKVVLKSYTRHSELAGPIETMSSSQTTSSTPTNVLSSSHGNTRGKRPSTKTYKAPLPPVEHKENLEQGSRQPRPSSKPHRAPAPPTRNTLVSAAQESSGNSSSPESSQRAGKSSHDYPVMHPHPWLPPSPGESKHVHTSPQASPGRRRASHASQGSPKKSASQAVQSVDVQSVSTTNPCQEKKGSTEELSTGVDPNVTVMEGSQKETIDAFHITASSCDEGPADEADSAPPLPDSPPPPLPTSLPPDEDTHWSQTVTGSCRTCIESLADVLMSLDMSLQNIMSTNGSDPGPVVSSDLDFDSVKSSLVNEAKTLSQQTKAIVSVVVQQTEGIPEIESALETVKSLAGSCCQCVEIMTATCSNFPLPDIRQTLLVAVMDVVGAFRQMVSATADTVAAGLEEQSVLLLMDRAKAMGSIMASLMRSLSLNQVKEQV